MIALATLVIRAPSLGNLNYQIDEGFYLLVGDRMRGGLLPYVDIWDRKPLGLFLLYRSMASLGNGSMVVVHLVAGAAAAATAIILAMMARRWTSRVPAFFAAVAYLAGLEALAGGGGQSPVFYNLPMAAMAFWTFKASDADTLTHFRRRAVTAVLCGGIALTIKQTNLPECLFFGCTLVLKLRTLAAGVVVRDAIFLAALGAFPSLGCFGFYVASGHIQEYFFATVLSSFGRMPMAWDERIALASYLVPRIAPLFAMAITGVVLLRRRPPARDGAGILAGWIGAASLGFLMVPNFYDHYALPLLPSLCIAAAPLFARRPLGPAFAALSIVGSLTTAGWPAFERTRRTNAAMRTAADTIRAHGGASSLYIFDGPVHLYTLTGAPLPTRWPFPEHLSTAEESAAIGADVIHELSSILLRQPAVIVAADQPGPRHINLVADAMLRSTLFHYYKRVGRIDIPEFAGSRSIEVFALRARPASPTRH